MYENRMSIELCQNICITLWQYSCVTLQNDKMCTLPKQFLYICGKLNRSWPQVRSSHHGKESNPSEISQCLGEPKHFTSFQVEIFEVNTFLHCFLASTIQSQNPPLQKSSKLMVASSKAFSASVSSRKNASWKAVILPAKPTSGYIDGCQNIFKLV